MPQPWPWVKVMERSSSTIPQTHTFFVPNIKGLAQTVLRWNGKVFAAADETDETDWKHKVTPERRDLIINNDNQILWTPGILYDSITIHIAFEIIMNPSMPENVNIWLTHWCQEILSNQLIDTRNVCVINSVRPGYNVFNSNTFYIDNNCTDNLLKMMWNQTGLIIWTTSATSQYLVWCWTSSGSLKVLCH